MISKESPTRRRRRITTHVSPHREQGDYHRQTSRSAIFHRQPVLLPETSRECLLALESRISYYLSEGHHVQLGNMGHFSAGLTARPVMDKKEIHAQTIFFGKVHFRVSPGFRKQCAGFVERVRAGYGFRHSEDISGAERYRRLCAFLDANPFITRKDYSGITGLLKNKALNDLNLLVEKGILTTLGQGSHKVYVRVVNQCVAE